MALETRIIPCQTKLCAISSDRELCTPVPTNKGGDAAEPIAKSQRNNGIRVVHRRCIRALGRFSRSGQRRFRELACKQLTYSRKEHQCRLHDFLTPAFVCVATEDFLNGFNVWIHIVVSVIDVASAIAKAKLHSVDREQPDVHLTCL